MKQSEPVLQQQQQQQQQPFRIIARRVFSSATTPATTSAERRSSTTSNTSSVTTSGTISPATTANHMVPLSPTLKPPKHETPMRPLPVRYNLLTATLS
jgi:transcription initiation factor TFIID subunit TAF12